MEFKDILWEALKVLFRIAWKLLLLALWAALELIRLVSENLGNWVNKLRN